METSTARIISERDLPAEIQSRAAALDFSHTKRPNCTTGCYNLVFETTCGHAYTVRKRCVPHSSVCTGTDILTVHITGEDTTLVLKRCVSCHRIQKSRNSSSIYNDMSFRRRHLYHKRFTPKQAAARARAAAVKEMWQRKIHDEKLVGLSRAQPIILEDESSGSSQRSRDPQADKLDGLEDKTGQPAPQIAST